VKEMERDESKASYKLMVDAKLIYDNSAIGGIDIAGELQKFIEDTNSNEFVLSVIKR
jgi:hypothetical protein